MGTTYAPDGYAITTGTWGTDADMDTTVFLSGDASLKFLDTTPANNPEVHTTEVPCEPGQPLLCESWMRASSIAAGNIPYLYIYWLDSAKGYLSATAVNDAVFAAADTWYLKSAIGTAPASTCYALVAMAKVKTAFTANYDCVFLRRFPKCFFATMAGDDTVSSGAEKMAFDTESYDHGSAYDAATNYRFTAPQSGIYSFDAMLNVADVTAAKYIDAEFYKNGALWLKGPREWNDSASDRDMNCSAHVSSALLASGDYVELYAATNATGPLTVSAARSWFSGTLIA